jgi:hypothetical protein
MRIYAFGDSFTNGYDDDTAIHVKEYIRWKGYKPKNLIDHLSSHYKCENLNLGVQGCCNLTILESFCENVSKITKDDIILINWTSPERMRVVGLNDEWVRIIPNGLGILNQTNISKKTVNEIMVNKTSKKYLLEVENWATMINHAYKDYKILQWSVCWDYEKSKHIKFINPLFETIERETKGEVKDGHFSESGNYKLSKTVIGLLKNKELI